MGIEFHLLLDPAEVERDRLLGVKRKSPKLIDFLGLKKKKRFPRRYSKGNNKGPDRAASEGSDGPWKLHKDLFSTDVGANWGHLLLPKADVEAHILNAEMLTVLETPGKVSCLRVRLVDDDEGRVYEGMKLTYYDSCNGYVLNGAWNKICKNRCLKVKDRVGLYWDPVDKVLHFSVRRRAEAARD